MDLHLVTYFVAVVDHGGITPASRELYISQPSLSQAIRTLERRLGVDLFDRSRRRLELTDHGRTFEVFARRILTDVERAKQAVETVRTLQSGRLDLVAHSSLSIDPLVPLVTRFREAHPQVVVNIIDTDGPLGVLNALRQGVAEVGVTDLSVDIGSLRSWPICKQEMVVVLPTHLAAGLADPVPLADVSQLPLVADLSDKGTRAGLDAIGESTLEHVVVDCDNMPGLWNLVSQGSAAAVMPRNVAEQELPNMERRSTEPPLRRMIGAVVRQDALSPAAERFLETVKALSTGEIRN
ncbi:LysR family transcriptional regulator [Rhodococcus sp. ACT016]|uniref:LysR family transcriptional regulator n=1 Tax=Rhodococcus sp. ACT016 TaxID=3134808 RepID=UPI003D286BB8